MNEKLKAIIRKTPILRDIARYWYWRNHLSGLKEDYPRGHFYSPLPDVPWVRSHSQKIYKKQGSPLPAIDFSLDLQGKLFDELSRFFGDFNFPQQKQNGFRYYSQNDMFGYGSGLILFSMLRHCMPKQIIEIGSGFTSALMLDTNEKWLNRQSKLTFIEPYPDRLLGLLGENDKTLCKIHQQPAQEIPLACFGQLQANDILFIDSSHVSKIGSDVNYIVFEILPALKPGVIIHFHDIYWPFEYPLSWIELGRAWNEAYLLRAFLQYNTQFEILLFNNSIEHTQPELLTPLAEQVRGLGSSLWLRKNQD